MSATLSWSKLHEARATRAAAPPSPREALARRRVAVGRDLSLVFENRDTLRFRLQELGRVARLTSADHVKPELDWYARLLPAEGTLRAAVWLGEAARRSAALRQAVTRGRLAFEDAGGHAVEGRFRGDRVQDRLIGVAGWAEFTFTDEDAAAFAEAGRGWHLVAQYAGQCSASEVLPDGTWRSLVGDLG